jgi:hypothetical protein
MTIRLRVLPRFPANITGGAGVEVERDGVDLVASLNYESLVQIPAVIDPDASFFALWNRDDDSYLRMSFTDVFDAVSGLGFMQTSIYDPTGIEADAFDRANHFGTNTPSDNTVTTAKIIDLNVTTAKLADASVTAAKTANDIVSGQTSKASVVDADEILIGDSAASGAKKRVTLSALWTWAQAKILTLFNASGSAPVYAPRAWVNFNGTGTVAIQASGNVTSITDNGTGSYTVNLTTAMADANYAAVLTTGRQGSDTTSTGGTILSGRSTTAISVATFNAAFASTDAGSVNLVLFR